MRIAFDAAPLLDEHMSGVGHCEAGLALALQRLYPEHAYTFNYFSVRGSAGKRQRLSPYMLPGSETNTPTFSPLVYRMMTQFIPVPYRWFFGNKADITHYFNYIVPPGVSGRTLVTVHDMVIRAFPETMRARTKTLLRVGLERSMKRADRIITVSEFSRQEILKYYPRYEDKIRIVRCGVDLDKFQPASPEEIERVRSSVGLPEEYFLFMGNVEPRKNLLRLIQAYAKLAERMPQVPKLVVAGANGWRNSEIYESVQKPELIDRVQFTNYIPEGDLRGLVCGATAFLFPSVYEGFGIPPLEAMACGVPVMASKTASLPEVTGDCAVQIDPYDLDSMAQGMEQLYTDAALRQDLAARGRERAKTLTWDAAAQDLMQVYQELI